jgi:hypothetical protein
MAAQDFLLDFFFFNVDRLHFHILVSAAFKVKMEPHKGNKTTIVCSYQAEEAGDYVITVTWSDKEVHGSPFKVHLKNSES